MHDVYTFGSAVKPCPMMVSKTQVLVSYYRLHKTVQTELKPISVPLTWPNLLCKAVICNGIVGALSKLDWALAYMD